MMLLELFLEAFEESKRIGCAASEASNNLIFIESSDFAGVAFHYGTALGHLTVTTYYNRVAAAHGEYRCTSILFQSILLIRSRVAEF